GGMYSALSAVMFSVAFVNGRNQPKPAGSDVVGAAQVSNGDTLLAALFTLRGHFRTVDTLIAHDPGQRPALFADRLLQQLQALQEGLGTGRAAGDVDVDRDELVDALNDRVDVVHATGVGAGTHGNHPLGLEHLLVQPLDDRCHLDEGCTGDDHEVRLAG